MGLGIKRQIKRVMWQVAPGMISRLQPSSIRQGESSIGIYIGEWPCCIVPSERISNPVLRRRHVSDVPAAYVADPFMVRSNNLWHMFFEVLYRKTEKGEIGLAISENGIEWTYQRIVLAEPFHLSYPYVFEWHNEYYMIPESWKGGGVRLYKATEFPEHWLCVGHLLEGGRFVDSSIFRYQGRWWLFTAAGAASSPPTLRLYSAKELMGTWLEHPDSPIVESNPHIARPSGRVLVVGETPIRYAQDIFPVYGSQVRAFEILELSPTTYKERQVGAEPILTTGGATWNSGGMHHIDAHLLENGTWLACVDGHKK